MGVRHALLCGLVLLAGCGGDGDDDARVPSAPPVTSTAPADPDAIPPDLLPPRGVPTEPDGTRADPVQAKVIERWARALRQGREASAARLFALPSRFQNVTPVLTIDSELERIAIHRSLTCGAVIVRQEGAGAYVLVTFRLVERPRGDCSGGVGERAQSVIRVRGGKIVEWYRLLTEPPPPPRVHDPGTPAA